MSIFDIPNAASQPHGTTASYGGGIFSSRDDALEQSLKRKGGGCVDGYVGSNSWEIYQSAVHSGANQNALQSLANKLLSR